MECLCTACPKKSNDKRTRSRQSLEKSKETVNEDATGRPVRTDFEQEIRELFRIFDRTNARTISLQEIGKAMRFLGMSPTEEEVAEAIIALDTNDTGRIDFPDFYSFMQAETAKLGDATYTQKEDVIRAAFQTFDKDGNGFIDANELRSAMQNLGECLTDGELDSMMREADVDGDGNINYEEFVKMWCKTR